jgi:hypothetical protein
MTDKSALIFSNGKIPIITQNEVEIPDFLKIDEVTINPTKAGSLSGGISKSTIRSATFLVLASTAFPGFSFKWLTKLIYFLELISMFVFITSEHTAYLQAFFLSLF